MAVTFAGEGAAMQIVARDGGTITLTVPGDAVALVVAIQCHGGGLTLTFGGVAVDLTMETGAQSPPTNYHTYLGFLADISGRANDDLVWNGPFGSTIPIQAAFLTADGPIEVIDWGWAAVAGNQIQVSLDPGSKTALAYVWGWGGNSDWTPLGSQVMISEITGANASYEEGVTDPDTFGLSISFTTLGYGVAALFADAEVVLSPSSFGIEVGFQAGLALVLPEDVTLYATRLGIEAGFQAGLEFRATGPRQVMLTGNGIETPEMTEGGTEGQVLTRHVATPPTWEDPAGGVTDHGALTGLGDDDHTAYLRDSDFSAKGAIMAGTGAGTYGARTVGTDGQVLTADAAEATGTKWTTLTGGVGEITDLPTAETDDALVLAPDGAGGVEWRAETGGAAASPALRVYLYGAFR